MKRLKEHSIYFDNLFFLYNSKTWHNKDHNINKSVKI